MKLEEKLVSLRKEKGISQLKLAEMMNVSRQTISRWEVGTAVPSTENLKYLGRLYDVPLEYLLHDDAPEPIRANRELERETNGTKKIRTVSLILIIIGIFVAILGASLFGNKEEKPVPMDNIEGSEMITESDFELEW